MKRSNTVWRIAGIILCALLFALHSCDSIGPKADKQQLFIGDDIAVAQTQYGKVQGFVISGIYTFLGIPYGADTGGKNRFMPPRPPQPWDDVRPAVAYGNWAPQKRNQPGPYDMFLDHWNYSAISEDCLCLNVWSPGTDSKRRPVLVWIHGGGFTSGSGADLDTYTGENFVRYADAVFVSINHRLNAFGFSDLSKVGDEKYKDSGNVGMLDIIAALKWVNKNIANFGGDPTNVTIMGQSGGGSKVCTVVSMPAAKGLMSKAVALSGSMIAANEKGYAEKLGAYIAAEAGIKAGETDKLQELPWEEYLDIANRAAAKLRAESPGRGRGGFGPVADGYNIPEGPYFNPLNESLADVPMMFCTTFNERSPNRDKPELENITLEEVAENISTTYGELSGRIVNAYAREFPDANPTEVWSLILSNRQRVVLAADAKLKQRSPVYMAWFGWQPPMFNERIRAFHGLDIGFWFMNTDLMVTHSGGGKKPRALSEKMASALLCFMHTGDPNTKRLPHWPQYTSEKGETMIFDNHCGAKDDPDRNARLTLP